MALQKMSEKQLVEEDDIPMLLEEYQKQKHIKAMIAAALSLYRIEGRDMEELSDTIEVCNNEILKGRND